MISSSGNVPENGLQPPLKVGLLLDDASVPAWFHQMISDLKQSEFADIALVVVNKNDVEVTKNHTLLSKISNNRGRIAYLAVRKLLEDAYRLLIERSTHLPDAESPTNTTSLLENLPKIEVTTRRGTWSDYFHDHDIEQIKSRDIDLLIRGGFGILRGDILNACRFGVWSFHHGDNLRNRGGPAGFWESMENWPETGSVLQILTEDLDNGNILYRSFSCTDTLSVKDNKNNYYWKTQRFMTRKIRELHELGDERFFEKVAHENRHLSLYSDRLYTAPNNAELARLTLKKIIEKTKLLLTNKFYRDQWILMFHLRPEFSSSLWRYKEMLPPMDRFWADPHVIHHDHTYYIFIEEYLYATDKGHIALIVMDEKGNYEEPEIVLEKPYHLSYPFVFEHEGDYFMIPETMANGTVELYKCTKFPNQWEFQMNLIEGIQAVDATLHYKDNRWWMFVTVVETDGASSWDELFIYYSDQLLSSEWKPHKQNPVLSDCKIARPAGKLFMDNDILYRPSQNCSHRYGYGFNLNEVEHLSSDNYREKRVTAVEPNWDKSIRGTHTFNRTHELHIIDAIKRRRINGR